MNAATLACWQVKAIISVTPPCGDINRTKLVSVPACDDMIHKGHCFCAEGSYVVAGFDRRRLPTTSKYFSE